MNDGSSTFPAARMALAGGSGLLGSAFKDRLGSEVTALPRDVVAGLDTTGIDALLRRERIEVLVNCVAHTNVESAETDPAPAWHANERIPGFLADACARNGVTMVHFSSTGCYGAAKSVPYDENDALQPPTEHHRSKAAGESRVLSAGGRALVLRTGWLYGGDPAQPKNFVWKRLLEARGKSELTSDASQFGCPTYVGDVADQTLALIAAGADGAFNVVAHGAASRFEYVSAIVRFAGIPCRVLPGPGFKRAAPVSANETAVNLRMQALGLDLMTDWRTSLRHYVSRLLSTEDWLRLPTG